MSDTTFQNCKCCEIEDDCMDGLCQCCTLYNQKLKASHAKLLEYKYFMGHKDSCLKSWQYIPPNTKCTCGLDQALKEAEKIK